MVEGIHPPLEEGLALEGALFIECQTDVATLAVQHEAAERYREAGDDEWVELD